MRISDWSSDVCSSDLDEVEEDRHREGKGEVPDEVALALVLEAGNMVPGGLTHLVFHCAQAGRREQWIEQRAKTGVERRIKFGRDHRPARSEERRVGKGGGSRCRSRCWPCH